MAAEGVVVDAGPLVAILSRRDQYHHSCTAEAANVRGPFYTAWPAIVEAAYLLKGRADQVRKLLFRVRDGRIRLLQLDAADIDGVAAILTQYSDQDLDLTDAVLMHLAEREGFETVFTVDHQHFSIFRTSKGRALGLIPAVIER